MNTYEVDMGTVASGGHTGEVAFVEANSAEEAAEMALAFYSADHWFVKGTPREVENSGG